MSRLQLSLMIAYVALAACGESKQNVGPPAQSSAPAPAGPLGYADLIANPGDHVGYPVEFKVSLGVGKLLLPTGETATASGQSWEDPPGTEHSIAPSKNPASPTDDVCVFLVMNDSRTPIYPLQLVVVDNLSPCLAGSTPPMLTGKLLGAKDVSLTINGQPANVKALTLSDPKFKAPF